jgi:ABC-type multidrug transport system permease subunit
VNQKRPRTFLQWMNGGRYVWLRWGIAYLIIVPSSVVLYQLLGWVGVLLVVVPTIGYAALVLLVETLVYHPRRLNRGPMFAFLPVVAWMAAVFFSPDDVQSTEYYKAMAQIVPVLLLAFTLERRREYHADTGPDYFQRFATVFVMLNLVAAGWITLVVLASKDDPTVGNARFVNAALASTVVVLVLSLITPSGEDRKTTSPPLD